MNEVFTISNSITWSFIVGLIVRLWTYHTELAVWRKSVEDQLMANKGSSDDHYDAILEKLVYHEDKDKSLGKSVNEIKEELHHIKEVIVKIETKMGIN